MIILRLILLVFIWITPVYGNSIYNLIKIPNLEIYEINTENRLKYFYATSSFRLGVQKNIICENSNRKDLDDKYNLIYKNLNKYTYNFLKKTLFMSVFFVFRRVNIKTLKKLTFWPFLIKNEYF